MLPSIAPVYLTIRILFANKLGDGLSTLVDRFTMAYDSSCTNGTTGSNPTLANLDLYIYDKDGNLVASSTTLLSNFEIVQFIPEGTGEYIIGITGSTDLMEHVGIALW